MLAGRAEKETPRPIGHAGRRGAPALRARLSPSAAPAPILTRWLAGELELAVSEKAELERSLAYPTLRRRIAPPDAAEFVSFLRNTAVYASDPPAPPRRSRDSGDDYVLALAEGEGAMVVSGDRHLLELADRFPIRTPRDFLEALETPR
ncbi:MAG: PIN domain-containing protein [Thermoleophilaceae bacterium]